MGLSSKGESRTVIRIAEVRLQDHGNFTKTHSFWKPQLAEMGVGSSLQARRQAETA